MQPLKPINFEKTHIVRFIATIGGSGVLAELPLNGRTAFPENRGPQPKPGEVWQVEIAGENPRKTVFFLKCIEKLS